MNHAAELRALIADMRSIEADYAPTPDTWTEEAIRGIFENPESERLLRGEHHTYTPEERREVDRLSKIAAEEARNQ
ncbi:MAG TPA: hypothetical protein VIP82_19115 [Microbacterium sp.]|uniref:hypothetical protein n=1 Tax=Microbacterium sp. TaxID=51671 RepID=UPI002F958BD7